MYRMYALSVSICGWFVDSRCSTAKVWFNKDGLIRSKSVAQEKYTDTNLSVSVCCQKLTIEFVSVYLSCAPDFERIQPSLLNHTLHSATKCIYSIYTVSQKTSHKKSQMLTGFQISFIDRLPCMIFGVVMHPDSFVETSVCSCFLVLSFFLICFLTDLLPDLSTPRTERLQVGGHRRRPNLALAFFWGGVHFMLWYILLRLHVCFVVLFWFSVLSQEIGWEEHLQNDLFCVGWYASSGGGDMGVSWPPTLEEGVQGSLSPNNVCIMSPMCKRADISVQLWWAHFLT